VFCGIILIGFVVWLVTNIIPSIESSPTPSIFTGVILGTISQPIGSAVAIAGAYLLIKHQKIGLFVSMTSVPILLINNRWLNFITIEGLTLTRDASFGHKAGIKRLA
jgi:hypothetical protein